MVIFKHLSIICILSCVHCRIYQSNNYLSKHNICIYSKYNTHREATHLEENPSREHFHEYKWDEHKKSELPFWSELKRIAGRGEGAKLPYVVHHTASIIYPAGTVKTSSLQNKYEKRIVWHDDNESSMKFYSPTINYLNNFLILHLRQYTMIKKIM